MGNAAEDLALLTEILRNFSVVEIDSDMTRWDEQFPGVDGVLWAEHRPDGPDRLHTIMHVTVNRDRSSEAQGYVLGYAIAVFGQDGVFNLPMPLVAPENDCGEHMSHTEE